MHDVVLVLLCGAVFTVTFVLVFEIIFDWFMD